MDFLTGEIICVDKPLKWTSFDAVKRIRGVLQKRYGVRKFKVGHAGTLDPLATGVMIICTGKATKQIDSLQAGVKEYIATIALGATTPSYDLETDIDARFPTDHITEPLVRQTLEKFVGTVEQIPPSFSACKINGKRAYKLARQGKDVDLKPKLLVIDNIELLEFSPEEIKIRVVCSKGTYIRALARDIGVALQSGGHLRALTRTRVGDISLENCLDLEKAVALLREVPIEYPDDFETKEK